MQSYDDFQLIPRKISNYSPTYMDKRHIVGQIAETGQKVVQRLNICVVFKRRK